MHACVCMGGVSVCACEDSEGVRRQCVCECVHGRRECVCM